MLRRDALGRWLASADVVRDDGKVLSWFNPRHPGYPYPEAAGLWLSWAAWRRGAGLDVPPDARVRAVADRLVQDLDEGPGVGRDGALYLFDTCVALDALARAADGGLADLDAGAVLARQVPALDRFAEADAPVRSSRPVQPRWSTSWSPHIRRAAALLLRAGRGAANEDVVGLARRLRGRSDRRPRRVLTHAHAYFLEGELLFDALGEPAVDVDVAREARRLAALQRPDGGLPAWLDGGGPSRADATAQAARIWSAVAPDTFAAPVRGALTFLRGLQDGCGGLAYEPDSADVNTWVSIFADQADHWAPGSADRAAWI